MGIHGNATCVMNYDGAKGWLVGEPEKGLQAMFIMMNAARLGVAKQQFGERVGARRQRRALDRDRGGTIEIDARDTVEDVSGACLRLASEQAMGAWCSLSMGFFPSGGAGGEREGLAPGRQQCARRAGAEDIAVGADQNGLRSVRVEPGFQRLAKWRENFRM